MTLDKNFDRDFMRRIRQVSRTKMINALLKEYYDETLEQAQTNPKSFGEYIELAEEDPNALAKQYARDFRKALMVRERSSLEILYANYVKDTEEIDIESNLE